MSLILTAATVAGYVALAAITLAIAGAVQGAYLRWQERRRTRREAARRDVARFRAGRLTPPAVEQQPGDPHSDDRIDAELVFIPAQRRKGQS